MQRDINPTLTTPFMSATPDIVTSPPTLAPTASASSASEHTDPVTPLNASRDARQIVRLAQCPQCSHPFREPVTLPCGRTLCKKCIPELHLRTNISYPATANRLRGFLCPFERCRREHAEGDYNVDVVLTKIIHHIWTEVSIYRNSIKASEELFQTGASEVKSTSLQNIAEEGRELPGGRLLATYIMMEEGQLAYDSEVIFPALDSPYETEQSDSTLLGRLKGSTRPELDCQVCYSVFLDPLTSNCGHTLCRKCMHRVLDHSNLCPICRQPMELPPGPNARQAPSNALLTSWVSGLFEEDLVSRIEVEKFDNMDGDMELDTPLFVCTISFPHMPTFLHIFEPRYRLMIRRVIEDNTRKFGMLLYNPTREAQGELGRVPFYEYGTLLSVVNMQLLPDGRSLLETVGISRFRVLRHSMLDGYTVGQIERVSDISITEEEAIEAAETSSSKEASSQDHTHFSPHEVPSDEEPDSSPSRDLDSLSTQELLEKGTSFIKNVQEQSTTWLHNRVVNAYGDCPNDAALFPWWFASIVPASNAEKYRMLLTTSVRERLKLCVEWAEQLEARRWYVNLLFSFCD